MSIAYHPDSIPYAERGESAISTIVRGTEASLSLQEIRINSHLPENLTHLLELDFPVKTIQPELPSRHMEVPYADD